MKKTFILLLSLGLLFSCGGDDSTENTTEENPVGENTGSEDENSEEENTFAEDIIGTWELQSYISDGVEYVEVYFPETDGYVCKDKEKFDGTYRQYTEVWGFGQVCDQQTVGDNDEAYTIEVDVLTINVPDENSDDNEDDYYTEVYTITQLDDTTMVLTGTYNDEDDGEEYTDISTYTRIEE